MDKTPENIILDKSGNWDKDWEFICRMVDTTPDIFYIYFSWNLFYLR